MKSVTYTIKIKLIIIGYNDYGFGTDKWLYNLNTVAKIIKEEGIVHLVIDQTKIKTKEEKVIHYLQYSQNKGTLNDEKN